MKINSNITAYITNNALKINENNYSASNRKLSSGYKINTPGDDPTGYAVSGRMKKMIRALERCDTNAVNGKSACETADGALSEITSMIQRMNELAVKSANGVLTSQDRSYIQNEVDQLKDEIQKISTTTEFNGKTLFDGTFVNKGYTTNKDIQVLSYSDETEISSSTAISITETVDGGKLKIAVTGLSFVDGAVNNSGDIITPTISVDYPKYYDEELGKNITSGVYTDSSGNSLKITADGDQYLTLNGSNGESITYKIRSYAGFPYSSSSSFNTNLTHEGAMRVQTGGNQNEYISITLPSMSTEFLDLDDLDLSTQAGASVGIGKISYALKYVNEARSTIGAYSNRLENAISFISESEVNLETSVSRIEDTDMAEEMTKFTNYQVLVQAATSMLAQANETPQMALQLLQ